MAEVLLSERLNQVIDSLHNAPDEQARVAAFDQANEIMQGIQVRWIHLVNFWKILLGLQMKLVTKLCRNWEQGLWQNMKRLSIIAKANMEMKAQMPRWSRTESIP